MANLNQVELNSIRECVSNSITMSSKFCSYSNKITDPDIKQMFKSASTKAEQNASKLIQIL